MQDIPKEIKRLSSALSQLYLPGAEFKYLAASNSILGFMMKHDLSPVADKIIKLLALPYPPLKRVVCTFLIRYADKISNLNILTTNCFLNDFDDPNPFVRRLVIKTVCHIPCLHEVAFQLIPLALWDYSAYVRTAAASSCTLIVDYENLLQKQNIIDILYELIRDPVSSVVASSLASLDIILCAEGGVVINKRLAHYLINRLTSFEDWHFATVCRVLRKYIPRTRDEVCYLLSVLDANFRDSHSIVFTSAAYLSLFYESVMKEKFQSHIIEQICPQVKFHIGHSSDEMVFEVLELSQKCVDKHRQYCIPFYKTMFCRFSDPTFIKVRKLQILHELGNDSNLSDIAGELLLHSYNCNKEVAVQSIKLFIKFLFLHSVSQDIIESFVQLMDIHHNNLNEEVLVALCSSKFEDKDEFKQIFLPAVSKRSSNINSVNGKLALLKLIANHGKYIDKSSYVIADLINDFQNVENESIFTMIVLASVKLFLVRPAEMQFLLGRVLQLAEQSNSMLLRKQSAVYHTLLINTSLSNKILLPKSEML